MEQSRSNAVDLSRLQRLNSIDVDQRQVDRAIRPRVDDNQAVLAEREILGIVNFVGFAAVHAEDKTFERLPLAPLANGFDVHIGIIFRGIRATKYFSNECDASAQS
jgi:hypothetical protein